MHSSVNHLKEVLILRVSLEEVLGGLSAHSHDEAVLDD